VLNRFPIRTHFRSLLWTLAGGAFLTCASPLAQASMLSATPDCSATGGGWSCYLPGILQFLVVIAIILGLILTAVIAVAVRSYFKIKQDGKV
jgi:hypothetical protein